MKLECNIKLILLLVLLGWGYFPTQLLAQTSWEDYRFVEESSPWLTSSNPTGLLQLNVDRISDVNTNFTKTNGGLINYHQSNDSYQFGGETKSLFRYNDKVVLKGSMKYTNFRGQNMSGSSFIDPYYNSFNIVEFDDENKGNKNLEMYHLVGGIAADIYKGLVLGGEFDFICANYSKMKDLRHANKLSDIKIGVGLSHSFWDILNLGLTYHYRKSIEGMYFNKYSPSEKRYEMLISYGNFWGKRTTFNTNTNVVSTTEMPMINKFQGISGQLSLQVSPKVLIYAEGAYSSRKGTYGLDKPSTVIYNTHNSAIYKYSFSLLIKSGRNKHRIDFNGEQEELTNYESVYEQSGESAGGDSVEYFDPRMVCVRKTGQVHLNYKSQFGIVDMMPKWEVMIQMNLNTLNSIAMLYPYYRVNDMAYYDANLGATRNIISNKNCYSISLSVGYYGGVGEPFHDGSYIEDPTQVKPRVSDQMMYREYEYLTSSQLYFEPEVRYMRVIKSNIKGFITLNYVHRMAMEEIRYLTSDKLNVFNISVGAIF